MIDFSTDTVEAKRQWIDIFKMLMEEEKLAHLEFYIYLIYVLKTEMI